MSKIIGIDLGTTNSVVSVMEAGQPTVIANEQGNRTTPSVVAFTSSGEELTGLNAKRQAVTNPLNTIFSIKRFMGRRHSEVGQEEKMVPYKIVGSGSELVKVEANGKTFAAPEISAKILRALKATAEAYLGETVDKAVITVPAYFNDSQRQATKDAGTIAGLEVVRILNEPTAAALAFGLEKSKIGKIAIYDFGGGTFDISVLDVEASDDDETGKTFEVLSTNGDTHLGGDDFDEVLVKWLADGFKSEHGVDLRADKMALQRLKEAAEKAKCELSTAQKADINLPFITATQAGPLHLQKSLSRSEFEKLVAPIVERTRKPCLQAIKDAQLKASDIQDVILVGGSTRIPAVQALVKEIFGQEPNRSVNPDEVVAIGAAIQGGILSGERDDVVLLDVTPLSLGIETLGGVMTRIIERNTTIPSKKSMPFSTADDNQNAVSIHVLQGERELAKDNRTLGRFDLTGIPPAPRGMPKIEVTFDIDANGILHVAAKDAATGKQQDIVITSSSGLSKDEIDRMTREAEEHASEDKKQREFIELKNKAEMLSHSVEKSLGEHGDKLSDAEKTSISAARQKLVDALASEDQTRIESTMQELEKASHKLAEILYKEQAAKEGASEASESDAGGSSKDDDDNVIDADYTVKN
ncbi:MAG: molecular chaperone DnaK [Planctomycetes bacterium]|nr:molecular chaperone DnaK [Planctomycetota bacterium]